jgi:hypothetical protein
MKPKTFEVSLDYSKQLASQIPSEFVKISKVALAQLKL